MDSVTQLILLGLAAGIAIPIGGWIARYEHIHPAWLENELRHFVIAFGGGALISAVALVLIPEGVKEMPIWLVAVLVSAGAIAFMGLDIVLAKINSPSSQLAAMMADFLPEALALGAFIADGETGFLLAFLIALQNLPEGFNAFRELKTKLSAKRILTFFALLALIGPLCTSAGYFFLADFESVLKSIMLFASGGILYLVFQDIAPQARMKKHWLPATGAVAGFLLGLIGHLMSK